MSLFKRAAAYVFAVLRWLPAAFVTGLIGGAVGTCFHFGIELVTDFRLTHSWVIWLLSGGGILVLLFYRLCRLPESTNTNLVIESAQNGKNVPWTLAPAIFVGTLLTHFVGGSAGREGAALQLGGTIGHRVGRLFRMSEQDGRFITLCGMAAVFSALFGTPVTAALFVLEVIAVGEFCYAALVPCLASSLTAFGFAQLAGAEPIRFTLSPGTGVTALSLLQTLGLAVACALLSIAFCLAVHRCEHLAKRLLKNNYLRAAVVGCLLLGMTLLVGDQTYNGAGMDMVGKAIRGEHIVWYAFVLKLLFTAVTLSGCYKGGEIVPTFFVGAAFGAVFGPLLGLSSGLSAAVGMVAVFCGVVNCPVASIVLSVEVFGGDWLILFAAACAVSYVFSGYIGLYRSQHIVYSKVGTEQIDVNTRD